MTKFIVLLRGINVSGQKKILMAELREMISALGFTNVQTYIQSGNIILDSKTASPELVEEKIYNLIIDNYGFEVEVFVIQPIWLNQIVNQNPYLNDVGDTKKLYLTILKEVPSNDYIKRLKAFNTAPDNYVIQESVIYINYRDGAGKSKLSNNLIESKLKVKATSRNWNTTLKLLELSSSF
jgi:uncharacterized protein (DUF1697 family)